MFVLALTGTVLLAGAVPAGACSCVENPPQAPFAFTGTAVEPVESGAPPLWRFKTDAVLRGNVGPAPLVQIYVPVENPDGTTSSTSCDIGASPPVPGRRYRVEAVGDVSGPLSVNACGGSLSPLSAPPSESPATELLTGGSSGRELWLTAAIAAAALLSVALVALKGRRRRGNPPAG